MISRGRGKNFDCHECEEALEMSMQMLEEFFPKAYDFMKNKGSKTVDEFKKKLYSIDRKTLAEETEIYISILKAASLNQPELCQDLEMLALNSDTPQSIFNRYKAASWVAIGLKIKQQWEEETLWS